MCQDDFTLIWDEVVGLWKIVGFMGFRSRYISFKKYCS
jgi:phosphatidylglycerophosphatase A